MILSLLLFHKFNQMLYDGTHLYIAFQTHKYICRFDISVLNMLAAQEMNTRRYAFHYEGNVILRESFTWQLKKISVSRDKEL